MEKVGKYRVLVHSAQ